eukprot:scaffold47927_cov31-Attheya_sp.AAC.1
MKKILYQNSLAQYMFGVREHFATPSSHVSIQRDSSGQKGMRSAILLHKTSRDRRFKMFQWDPHESRR